MERKWWTLIAVSIAIFMLLLDITVVNVALPDIQRSLHSSFSDLQWVVDAYALTLAAFLLTSRLGRRPDRAQARVHRRPVRVHDLLGRLRPVHHAADAQPRARRAGHRRGDDVRHLAGADRPGLPRQGARHGLRRVRRRHRRRGRRRPGGRRDHHLGHRLGVDLLRQRADRHRRGVHRAHPGRRTRATRTPPASTGRASSPSPGRCSCSCTRSSRATKRAGARPRSSPCSAPPSC